MPEREYPCVKKVGKDPHKIKAGKYSAFSYLITADINVLNRHRAYERLSPA